MKNKQTAQLLLKSRGLFMKYGIKNLTMDDIAKELGMSKKTIYQFVENKAELVKLVMQDYLDDERTMLDEIEKKTKNSIEEMIAMVHHFSNVVREFNPTALYDMKKHYPDAWDIYNDYRFHNALKRINSNLKNGVKEGIYRDDLNPDIVARIYIGGIELLMSQEFFPSKDYVFLNIYTEFLNYHLKGIVSSKGLKILEEHNLFKHEA